MQLITNARSVKSLAQNVGVLSMSMAEIEARGKTAVAEGATDAEVNKLRDQYRRLSVSHAEAVAKAIAAVKA